MKQKTRPSREVEKFRDLARTVANHHFGSTKQMKYLAGGLTNFVFSFKTPDGDFVIRVSPQPERIDQFIKEQWASEAAAKAGVPIAEILEVGSEGIGFPYMVTRSVNGTEATHHPKRMEIVRELGRLAARINSIHTKGFGNTFDWSSNKLSKNSAFKEWLYGEFDAEGKLELLASAGLLTDKRAKAVRKIFAEFAGMRSRPSLNHSDVRLKNVIADEEGKILAVIDWEGAASNVPAWELSLALHDLGIDAIQAFLSGYGMKTKKLEELMPLIRAFNVANYASAIGSLRKDKKALEHYKLRLAGTLDLYSF